MTNFTEKEKEKIYDYIDWVLDDMDKDELMDFAFKHFKNYYFSLTRDELIEREVLK